MIHPLDGVRLKLARAQEHLDEISFVSSRFKGSDCSIIRENDPNSDLVNIRLRLLQPPLKLSIIIGEFLYVTRSALDNLVSGLAENTTPNRTEAERRDNKFPICISPERFRGEVKGGRLNGVPDRAQAFIESVQPYNGGKRLDDPLWILNKLGNMDKHRALTVTTALTGTSLEAILLDRAGKQGYISVVGSTFRNGDVIAAYNLKDGGLDATYGKMKMQIKTSLFIAFQDAPVTDCDVRSILEQILRRVRNFIVPGLEPFFN
jgi:hypothetical protein